MENLKQIPVGSAKDLTGQHFGELTVLYRTENKCKTATCWVCQCSCGTIKPILAQNLIKGKTTSCGCKNREKASQRMSDYNYKNTTNIIGQRFGKLIVIKDIGLRKQKSRNKNTTWYLCQCDCGNYKEVDRNSLISGNVRSCGCIASAGEQRIAELLTENNIAFTKEYTFPDLINPKTNRRLRFDFAVYDENNSLKYLIEFDGRQHYEGPDTSVWSHTGNPVEELKYIQYKDKLKDNYCRINNIPLIRIKYTRLNNLTINDLIYKDTN